MLLSHSIGYCQSDSSLVHIQFSNENKYEIRVDNRDIYTTDKFYLANGVHTIEIWNARLELIRDTIAVAKNNTNVFRYKIEVATSYLDYKKQERNYQWHKWDRIIIPSILTVGAGTAAILYYRTGRNQSNDLLGLKEDYGISSDPIFLSAYEETFNQMHDEYDKTRRIYYGFIGATALAATWSFFGIKSFSKKFTRPTNNFYQSPFTQKDYALSFGFMPGYAHFTFTF